MRRHLARLAAAAALVIPAGLVGAAPGQAAPCVGTSGVTVIVQWGDSLDVRCAPGDPTTGADALAKAGFGIVQVRTQPGFVCRISGNPSSDPCINTPPASAYWSYWHANPGQSWIYSNWGAYAPQSDPAPGSYQAWRFGSGQSPAYSVPRAAAPSPAPRPTTRTTTAAPRPSATSRPTATKGPSGAAPEGSAPVGSAPRTTKGSSPAGSGGSSTSGAGGRSTAASGSTSGSASSTTSATGSATKAGSETKESATKSASAAPSGTTSSAEPSAAGTAGAASAPSPDADPEPEGTVTTAVVGGGLVAALAGAGLLVWRRRRLDG